MNNKYLYLVLAGVMSVIWYHVGHLAYFADPAGGLTDGYWYALVVAVGLGAGSTGGDDAISILVASVTEYVPTAINLAIFAVVAGLIYSMGIQGNAFDAQGLLAFALGIVVSALLTNATLSYLKKA